MWDNIEKLIKSIVNNSIYLTIILLMVFFSSLIFPTLVTTGFESLGKLLPYFITNYFKNLSLNNTQIFSILQLLSILHMFSVFLLLLSHWKLAYFKEITILYGFFANINIYFVLLLSILYRLEITSFNIISQIFNENTNWDDIFPALNFALVCLYIFNILIRFVRYEDQ